MKRFTLHSVISASLKVLFPSHDALELSIQLHDLGSSVVDVAVAVSLLGGIKHAALEVGGVRVEAIVSGIGGPRLTLGDLLRLLGANDNLIVPLTFFFILRIELLLHSGAELKEDEVVLLTSHNKEEERKSVYRLGNHVKKHVHQMRSHWVDHASLVKNPQSWISDPDGEVGGASDFEVEAHFLHRLRGHLIKTHLYQKEDVVPRVHE
mmetsp:Transcript_24195/g.20328  ORF Transcript_24195/g.20328 Transcript_24195/m.20328 type:complete len:208 (+) Transcript_24195:84-707(+)